MKNATIQKGITVREETFKELQMRKLWKSRQAKKALTWDEYLLASTKGDA